MARRFDGSRPARDPAGILPSAPTTSTPSRHQARESVSGQSQPAGRGRARRLRLLQLAIAQKMKSEGLRPGRRGAAKLGDVADGLRGVQCSLRGPNRAQLASRRLRVSYQLFHFPEGDLTLLECRCQACGHVGKIDPTRLPPRYHAMTVGSVPSGAYERRRDRVTLPRAPQRLGTRHRRRILSVCVISTASAC